MAEKAEWSELQTLPDQILKFGVCDAIASLGCLSRGISLCSEAAQPAQRPRLLVRCDAAAPWGWWHLVTCWKEQACSQPEAVLCFLRSALELVSHPLRAGSGQDTSGKLAQCQSSSPSAIQQTEPPPSWGLDKQTPPSLRNWAEPLHLGAAHRSMRLVPPPPPSAQLIFEALYWWQCGLWGDESCTELLCSVRAARVPSRLLPVVRKALLTPRSSDSRGVWDAAGGRSL